MTKKEPWGSTPASSRVISETSLVLKTSEDGDWVSSETNLVPQSSEHGDWVRSKSPQVPKTCEDGDSTTWELTLSFLFQGSPRQRDP